MGVAGLFFVEPGVKVDGKYSQDVLHHNKCYPLSDMLQVTISSFSRTAHRHIGRVIQSNSCRVKQLISFFQRYAPNSPDLNPIDYKIWGFMQQHVCEMQVHNVDEFKRRLVDVWGGLPQSVVDAAVSEWRKRLHSAVVCSREGRTFRTPAVCCFDSGMKLSIDSPCTTCF